MRVCLVLPLLIASPAWATDAGMLLLERAGWQTEEAALIQALRIYTQDLEVPFRTDLLPAAKSVREEVAVAARACESKSDRLDVVLWFGRERATPSLLAYHCATRDLREAPCSPAEDLDLATQTLALKVRWLLTNHAARESNAWRPVPEVPERLADQPAPAGAAAAARAGQASDNAGLAPAPRSEPEARRADVSPALPSTEPAGLGLARPDVVSASTRSDAGPRTGPVLALAYGLDGSSDGSWLRSSLVGRVALPLGRGQFCLAVDGSIGSRGELDRPQGRGTVRDYPLGIAFLPRLDLSRWRLTLGPRASLHVLSAEATSADGRHGSAYNLVMGMGFWAEAQLGLSAEVRAFFALAGDYDTLQRQFTLDGQKAFDFGPFHWASRVGLAFALR